MAVNRETGQKVAMKIARINNTGSGFILYNAPLISSCGSANKHILREIQLLTTFQHENIIKFYEGYKIGHGKSKELWIALEYMDCSLRNLLLKKTQKGTVRRFIFDEPTIAYIMYEVSLQLAFFSEVM
jgi:serine/threonine protein kinase